MVINFGFLPRYARCISLVLKHETGFVSPQIYVKHDKFFETMIPDQENDDAIINWKM